MTTVEVTASQPVEGTEVTLAAAAEGSTAVQTPSPEVSVEGQVHFAPSCTGGNNGYWLAELPSGFARTVKPFSGTIQPDTVYYVVTYVGANYGYYFHRDHLEALFNGKHADMIDAAEGDDGELLLVFGGVESIGAPSTLVSITEQPQDVDVAYPDGATFSVKVDHPELVDSYQWKIINESPRPDGTVEYSSFLPNGKSASTDTLVLPSTESDSHRWFVYCIITDIEGHTAISQQAIRTVSNWAERKHVLYVGEYAIEPGESLDLTGDYAVDSNVTINLADEGLGSGSVDFDADGHNLTLNDFKFTNETWIFDSENNTATALFLSFPKESADEAGEYYLHLNGDAVIDNRYFQEISNSGGVTLNCWFATTAFPNKPALTIDSDNGSTLTLKGGQYGLYMDGELVINADVNVEPFEQHYCDGLRAHNIYIEEGVKANLNCLGSGMYAYGDIYIENGAEVEIDSLAPHVSNGATTKSLIDVAGNIHCHGAKVSVRGNTVPELCKVASFSSIEFGGTLACDASDIQIVMDSQRAGKLYAINFCGILGSESAASLEMTNGSTISVDIDVPEVRGASGIMLSRNLSIEDGCAIQANVAALGRVIGIYADNMLEIRNAHIDVNAKSYSDDSDSSKEILGVNVDGAVIDCQNCTSGLTSTAEDGVALAVGLSSLDIEPSGYDPTYKPSLTSLAGTAAVETPFNGAISNYTYKSSYNAGRIFQGESVYDPADTSAPAQEVRILGSHSFSSEDTAVKKATPTENGSVYRVCSACGSHVTVKSIPKPRIKLAKTSFTFNKKACKPEAVVTDASGTALASDSYEVTYSNNVHAGTATAKVKLKGEHYEGSIDLPFTIGKASNTLSAKGKTVKIKYSQLKKKSKTFKRAKVIGISKAKGTVTYKLVSVKKAKFKKYFKVNAKTGKLTVKKGLKSGTYRVKIKVTAGSKDYEKCVKNANVKVKVK